MVLVLLEGTDCAGKTQFAGRVVDALRASYPQDLVTYHHAGVPQEHPLEEYVEPLLDYRPGTGRHVVCDRWYLGEVVYPTVIGRASDMTPAVRWYVEAFLRSRGAVQVYCAASYGYLHDCGTARGDDHDELVRILPTQEAFQREVVASAVHWAIEDVTDEGQDASDHRRAALRTVAFASHHASRTEALNPFATYVGPPRPRLLLVGDRRGTPAHDLDEFGDWPAFVPTTGTSGRYLLDALTSAPPTVAAHGLTLGDVGLVNANDVDDVHACWDALGRPEVVGLGVEARRTLRRVHVPHRSAAHPQYVRRFLHHRQDAYVRELLGHRDVTEVVA